MTSLIGWVRSLLFNILFFSTTILLLLVALPVAAFVSPAQMRRYARFWMRIVHLLLRLTMGIRHEVTGLQNLPDTPVILASKHQSAWETLFFHTIRADSVFGLKEELGRIPGFGWFLKIAGNIFIDRGGAAKALRSLIDGAKHAVAQGCSILIFPEGTRRPPGAEPDYKSGVAALYSALGVPVVPVALNSGTYWPRRSFIKRAGTIKVEFLEPIPPGLDRQTFMRRLQEAIETRQAVLDPDASTATGQPGP